MYNIPYKRSIESKHNYEVIFSICNSIFRDASICDVFLLLFESLLVFLSICLGLGLLGLNFNFLSKGGT